MSQSFTVVIISCLEYEFICHQCFRDRTQSGTSSSDSASLEEHLETPLKCSNIFNRSQTKCFHQCGETFLGHLTKPQTKQQRIWKVSICQLLWLETVFWHTNHESVAHAFSITASGLPWSSDRWTRTNLSRAKPDIGAKWAEVIRQIGEYCVLATAKAIGNIRCAFQAVIKSRIWGDLLKDATSVGNYISEKKLFEKFNQFEARLKLIPLERKSQLNCWKKQGEQMETSACLPKSFRRDRKLYLKLDLHDSPVNDHDLSSNLLVISTVIRLCLFEHLNFWQYNHSEHIL